MNHHPSLSEDHNQEPLLEVNGLKTQFQTRSGIVRAVNDVSFSIRKGETIGIVGESGSGKSVTALSIMRLIDQPGSIEEGSIKFNSKQFGQVDLIKLNSGDMRKIRGNEISMIFQEPMSSLNPVYTCGDQVMESILLHQNLSRKPARQRTLELFERVRLPQPEDIFNSYPHQLSGGQKQRVMIAMALSCNPQLLIADEPTTALDVTVQSNILRLFAEFRDDLQTSVIFITHDLGVISEVADRVVVMYQGKIVEEGTVWDIFSNPQHPYTKGLLACRPRLDLKLKVLPTVADFMGLDTEGRLTEKNGSKYNSVGEALLYNVQTGAEIEQQQQRLLAKKPILEVENLKTYFPTGGSWFKRSKEVFKAVDDVSFQVYTGETLGLVGESGCGKTTLGRSILRLIEPTAGKVYFEGNCINDYSPKEMRRLRQKMQIVFQDPYSSLNPRHTIGRTILEPMKIHGVLENERQRRDKVMYLLERVNLNTDHFNRYPHEFSGGQRQRICIARTLALEPKFIICDESVSALDVSVQAQVLNLLNELKQDFGLTYIFISHDLSVVKFISDRIMVMNKGQLVETGFPEQLYENPREAYTQTLINAIPKGKLEDIRKAQLARKLALRKT
jgi:peptide/nickel transport system ATP-binding protein